MSFSYNPAYQRHSRRSLNGGNKLKPEWFVAVKSVDNYNLYSAVSAI